MERIVFIVEGDCEVAFINQKVIPYLYSFPFSSGWNMNAQKVTTNRRLNAKGGNVSFEYLNNEIRRVSAQGHPWITTFMDFYRIPPNFPGYKVGCTVNDLETGLKKTVSYDRFLPYIQKYEFETLFFSKIEAFNLLCDTTQMGKLQDIVDEYPEIENINGGRDTAPSKRLSSIFNYHKVADSRIVLDEIPFESMLEKSPRLKTWIDSILVILKECCV